MSKIIFAWELGGGYGHIDGFLPVAKLLQTRGHEIIFVLKNLEYAVVLLGEHQFAYLQAPFHWSTAVPPPAMNYAGILRNTGFADVTGLLARTLAWNSLFEYLDPDLILFDHAPTALLATRSLKIPRALFGSGFFSPPRISPMPSIRPWLKIPERELSRTETDVVTTANKVLDQTGGKRLNRLADLFDVEEDFLCTFAELDHYQDRNNAVYWGHRFNDGSGVEPVWPSIGTKRIFAYLKNEYSGLEVLLRQLQNGPWSVLAHIPGITPAFLQKFSSAHLHISPHPVNLGKAGQQCDMVICHAGAGTTTAVLLRGKPLLLLPMQVEQLLIARNVVALGAGLSIPAETKKPGHLSIIKELLANGAFTAAAGHFAERYGAVNATEQLHKIADRCEELLVHDSGLVVRAVDTT